MAQEFGDNPDVVAERMRRARRFNTDPRP